MTVPETARLVEAAERSTLTSRSAAIGAIRAARRAGNHADSTVMPTPTANDRIIACALITIGPLGISYPNAAISTRRPDATPTPATRPATDAEHTDDERLDQHRALDLPPGGADRTQHRHVAGALGDGDRERVVDDEGADEDGDEGEHEHDHA